MSENALDQVRNLVSEKTRAPDCADLNTFLEPLEKAYDDPNRVRTAVREICPLKQKNQLFPIHLASFRRILGDLHLDDEAIKDQLY